MSATESLWVDELHTSWAISGSLGEVFGRSVAGNQSPLFFWLMWGLTRTVGGWGSDFGEMWLRLPSILAWTGSVVTAALYIQSQPVRRSKEPARAEFPDGVTASFPDGVTASSLAQHKPGTQHLGTPNSGAPPNSGSQQVRVGTGSQQVATNGTGSQHNLGSQQLGAAVRGTQQFGSRSSGSQQVARSSGSQQVEATQQDGTAGSQHVGQPVGGAAGSQQVEATGVAGVWAIREVGVVRRAQEDSGKGVAFDAAVAALLWLSLDRFQWFYATEARPFASLAFLSLLGWLLIDRAACNVLTKRLAIAWTLLSIIAFSLHITAALAIGAQWIWGWWFGGWGHVACTRSTASPPTCEDNPGDSPSDWTGESAEKQDVGQTVGRSILSAGGWLLCGLIVLTVCGGEFLATNRHVWEHRQAWASFASETSFQSLVTLFPLQQILLPTVLTVAVWRSAVWLRALISNRRLQENRRSRHAADISASWRRLIASRLAMWTFAFSVPWGLAWVITWLEIAPIFHRRYVIVAAIPMVLAAVELLRTIPNRFWRLSLIGLCVWFLIVDQGTLAIWRSGSWIGWLRGEDWRGAAAYLNREVASGGCIFVASGLIEGDTAAWPLSSSETQYLSYPLRDGLYANELERMKIERIPVVGPADEWPQQIHSSAEKRSGIWLVTRYSRKRLEERLNLNLWRDRGVVVEEMIGGFGKVSMAKLRIVEMER